MSPTRTDGFLSQRKARLSKRATAFAAIALETTRNNVLPCRFSTERARYDMVEIEFRLGEPHTTVLASKSIPHQYVLAAKANMPLRQVIIIGKHDDPRHANEALHRANHIFFAARGRVRRHA